MKQRVHGFPYRDHVRIPRLAKLGGISSELLRRAVAKEGIAVRSDGLWDFIPVADQERAFAAVSDLLAANNDRKARRALLISLKMKEQYVYFMRSSGCVKIGTADNVHRRRAELQVGNPFPIKVAAYIIGNEALEERIQAAFGDKLVQGEWYRDEDGLAELVDRLAAVPSPAGATAAFKDLWRYRDCTDSRRKSRSLPEAPNPFDFTHVKQMVADGRSL